MPSFDVVSEVDMHEVDNALGQARKELGQRYDFKGSNTEIEQEGNEVRVVSSDDFKVKAAVEVVQGKMAKRKVALKALEYGAIEPAAGGRAKQVIRIQRGISDEKARKIVKLLKSERLKVQAQIQGEQVRVSGKKRDDLQSAIQRLRDEDFGLPLQFVNFRD